MFCKGSASQCVHVHEWCVPPFDRNMEIPAPLLNMATSLEGYVCVCVRERVCVCHNVNMDLICVISSRGNLSPDRKALSMWQAEKKTVK